MSKTPDPRKVPPRPAMPTPARPAAPRPASAPKAGHAPTPSAAAPAKTGALTTTKAAGPGGRVNGAAPTPAAGVAKKTAPAAKTAPGAKTPHRIPSGHTKSTAAAASEATAPVARPRRRKVTMYLGGLLVSGAIVGMAYFGVGRKPKKIVAPPPPPPAAAAYTEVELRLDGRDYKLVASVAVQVAKKDLEWAQQNNGNFYRILEHELLTVDPRMGREPAGLTRLQDSIKTLLNEAFGGDRIQQIWITEFAYLPDTLYEK